MRLLNLALLACAADAAALNASIVDGVLSINGAAVGTTTSAITGVIARYFAAAAPRPAAAVNLKNSSAGVYSYLTITGAYDADAAIELVAQLVLVLDGATFTVLPAFKAASNAVISALHADDSAVVAPGGAARARVVCPAGGPQPAAVYAGQSANFVLDGLAVANCGLAGGAAVHIEGLPMVLGGEVANCVITNASSRAIWTEKCSRVVRLTRLPRTMLRPPAAAATATLATLTPNPTRAPRL